MISESDGKGYWLKAPTLQCSQSPHVQFRGAMGASCSGCGRRDESRTDHLAIMRAVDEATFASLEAEAKTAEVLLPKHAVPRRMGTPTARLGESSMRGWPRYGQGCSRRMGTNGKAHGGEHLY
jgi:hypothetical protein